jgi:SAM-dependent methyltransferase
MTTDPAMSTRYFAAEAEATDELGRLRLIEATYDATTFRILDAIGVGVGWRCLEVGAGGGSVTRWLSERVGPSGQVVAADLDPRFLGGCREPNIEVRRCDITRDDIEQARYDLIHCRTLLMHLDDPVAVLGRMAAALRPGGWLLAEEPDLQLMHSVDGDHPLAEGFDVCTRNGAQSGLAMGVFDPYFGRSLFAHVARLGFVEIQNEGSSVIVRGGEPLSQMWMQSWDVLSRGMLETEAVTDAQLAELRRALQDPTFTYYNPLMLSVWGRKP